MTARFFFYLQLIFVVFTSYANKQVEIEVLVPTYNQQDYCIKNLESLIYQNYPSYHITIVDDNSKDRTVEILENYIRENNLQNKVTLIKNSERVGALANLYNNIRKLDDHKVVITVDGDDELYNENALSRIAHEYNHNKAWVTYGQFSWDKTTRRGFCANIPERMHDANNYRSYMWVASHPRTFYAGLFKKIDENYLKMDGAFFPTAWDLAIMFCLLEMAGKKHIKFIPDILYVYNTHTDPEVSAAETNLYERTIRAKKPYHKVKSPFSN